MSQITGQTKVSAAEYREHDFDLYAKRIVDVGSNLTMRIDYDTRTDDNPVYVGLAAKGLSESATGWLLYKFEYDANNRIVSKKVAYGSWDNRASATYE